MTTKIMTMLATLVALNSFYIYPAFAGEEKSTCVKSSSGLTAEEYEEIHNSGD